MVEQERQRLIDAGVDCLHPLQAKAKGMDAADLLHAGRKAAKAR